MTILRRSPHVLGCQSSDLTSILNAAELCQMLRAESDGPSTFHRTSDVSPCLDQVALAAIEASTLSGSVPRKGSYRDLATTVTSALDPLATIPSLVRSGS